MGEGACGCARGGCRVTLTHRARAARSTPLASISLLLHLSPPQVARHPGFRLIAAMNPATDAGKRELPAPLRNRFTEIWVPEPTQREDLRALVHSYLAGWVGVGRCAGVCVWG